MTPKELRKLSWLKLIRMLVEQMEENVWYFPESSKRVSKQPILYPGHEGGLPREVI